MKLYAPKYYKEFKCIADRCKHSCCVGWEINIDCDTAKKYSLLSCGYGLEIKNSIETSEDSKTFRLLENNRCPHLDGRGLCRIISEFGEEYLCDICREHPRFYNTLSDRAELGIGMACEEACRIILASDDYAEFYEVGEYTAEAEYADFDALALRSEIFSILSDRNIPYTERAEVIARSYCPSFLDATDESLSCILSSLEYLSEDNKDRFMSYFGNAELCGYDGVLERALAYFIYRHASCAVSESDFSASVGFALFCVRLAVSIIIKENKVNIEDITEVFRTVSEELEYSEENTEAIRFELLF